MVETLEPTLTSRQRLVFDAIVAHLREERCPPTRRELSARTGIENPNAIQEHLRAIEMKGLIVLTGKSSGIRLVGAVVCPCCGLEASQAEIGLGRRNGLLANAALRGRRRLPRHAGQGHGGAAAADGGGAECSPTQ